MAPAHHTRAFDFFLLLFLLLLHHHHHHLLSCSLPLLLRPPAQIAPFFSFIPLRIPLLGGSKIKDSPVREHVELPLSFFVSLPRSLFLLSDPLNRALSLSLRFLHLSLIMHNTLLCNVTRDNDRIRIDANIS